MPLMFYGMTKNKILFRAAIDILKDEVLQSFLKVLAFYAVNLSPAHTANVAYYFLQGFAIPFSFPEPSGTSEDERKKHQRGSKSLQPFGCNLH